jgi:hypothetical protein
MKAVTIKQLKDELAHKSASELKELCLHLSRFKKENKELLTYLLFESHNEDAYIQSIKDQMDVQFAEINTNSFFYIRKSVRKILSLTKKLKDFKPSISRSQRLQNVFDSQVRMIKKAIEKLHEDLQYDYQLELDNLLDNE